MLRFDELTYHEICLASKKCKESLMYFTKFFFTINHKRKFVVNTHHEEIAMMLEKVMTGEITRLIINIAPRYGKTELAVKNFIAHALAVNPSAKFIHLSYSNELAIDNSEEIKNIVNSYEYQTLFPETKIKQNTNAKKKWYTTKNGGVYAIASAGQVTGFGAGKVDELEEAADVNEFINGIENKQEFGGAIVIDDPIKPDDAESSTYRNKVNNKYETTIKNRVNSRKTPIIVIMQRLHPNDLCGHLIKEDGDDWYVVQFPCLTTTNGKEIALWKFKHTVEELRKIRGNNSISLTTFERQYQQNPKPLEGLLYTNLKTYSELPFDVNDVQKFSYTDTADEGTDYLCTVVFARYNGLIYIIDVQYNDKPQEVTEPETTELLQKNKVNYSVIESNNGGRAFARNVTRLSHDAGNHITQISWFHQSKNKDARIRTNASTVQNMVVFPDNWAVRWQGFYDSVTEYMARGKNDHDDAADVLTGCVEIVENHSIQQVY